MLIYVNHFLNLQFYLYEIIQIGDLSLLDSPSSHTFGFILANSFDLNTEYIFIYAITINLLLITNEKIAKKKHHLT